MSQASLDAYISIAEALPEKRRRVYEVLVRYCRPDDEGSGATLKEIATALELGQQIHLVSGRVTELKNLGLIYDTGMRREGQTVWRVENEPPLLLRFSKPERKPVYRVQIIGAHQVDGKDCITMRLDLPAGDGPLSKVGEHFWVEVR